VRASTINSGDRTSLLALVPCELVAIPATNRTRVLTYAPALLRRLSELLPADAIITCDVGQHQMWVAQHCLFDRPEAHLSSSGLGTMGFGLPATPTPLSIGRDRSTLDGAQLSKPGATVVNVSGDGSFLMNVQELATVTRLSIADQGADYRQPVAGHGPTVAGAVLRWQLQRGRSVGQPRLRRARHGVPDRDLENKPPPRYRCHPQSLAGTSRSGLLHVPIDSRANVWLLVPPKMSNDQMLDESPEAIDDE
jgi:acetolactate synthase-1/2/3 large subunit